MLDRDGGEVGIRREVPGHSDGAQKALEDVQVARSGLSDLDDRLIEPRTDMMNRLLRAERLDENRRMRHQPDEPVDDCPEHADSA